MPDPAPGRWIKRPILTWCVRALAVSLPIGATIAAGLVVGRALGAPSTVSSEIGHLALVFAASIATFVVVGRGARRLIPLAMLLRLSLVFPDQAPSRFGMALRASNPRRLQERARRQTEGAGAPDAAQQAETVLTLIVALGAHDRKTRGHSERVQALTDLVAQNLGLSREASDRLRWGALLHDLGKLSVPARILNLPGRPNAAELRTIRRHPAEGVRLAEPLASWLGEWRHAIDQHHERYDGRGYPLELSGTEISLAGRIVAVTDAFETMTAVRSYKKAMNMRDARAELVDSAGTHFDPNIVRTFLDISVGKLRWTLGLVTAVAELPIIGLLPRVASVTSNGFAAAAPAAGLGGAAILGLGVLTLPGAPVAAHPPVPTRRAAVPNPPSPASPPVTVVPIAGTLPAGAGPTVTSVAGVAGGTTQNVVQTVSGAVGATLGGLRTPLRLPGAPSSVRLPLP